MKRISSRAIIFEEDYVYTFYRKKLQDDGSIKEYYVLPGGGLKNNETIEQTVIRELKEEFCVDIKINKYLSTLEDENSIIHFFECKIIKGTPKLGGEELHRCSDINYYKICKIPIKEITNYNIFWKDIILEAWKKNMS